MVVGQEPGSMVATLRRLRGSWFKPPRFEPRCRVFLPHRSAAEDQDSQNVMENPQVL